MRTAIVANAGIWGGAETHAVGLARALIERGGNVVIFCATEQTYELYRKACDDAIEVLLPVWTNPLPNRTIREWAAAFKSSDADMCVFEKGTLHSCGVLIDLAARWCFRRYVVIEQLEPMRIPSIPSRRHFAGLVPGIGLWRHQLRLQGYLRSISPHAVVTVSNSVQEILAQDYGFPRRKMITVWNGADISKFQLNEGARQSARAKWGLAPNTLVFGSLRRFCHDKGLDIAIRAFAKFQGVNPDRDSALVLVGDGPERVSLEELARECGVGDRIVFPGFSSEPWNIYPALDVFVMPSRTEALSLALVEAMASGCLAIASNIGGSAEVISCKELGWIVPPEDVGALTEAMVEAADLSESEIAARQTLGRTRVAEHFDARKQYGKIIQVIEGTLASLKRRTVGAAS